MEEPRPDPRVILAAIEKVGASRSIEEFAVLVCEALLELIPGVSASYNELDFRAGRIASVVIPDPGVAWYERYGEMFGRLSVVEHPFIVASGRDGDPGVATWLDLDPERTFESTELFTDFYVPNGIRSQLSTLLPGPSWLMIGISINRDGTDFTREERAIVEALRPHLANLHQLVLASKAEVVGEATRQVDGWEAVVVSDEGTVLATTPDAVAMGGEMGIGFAVGQSLRGTALWPWEGPPQRDRSWTINSEWLSLPTGSLPVAATLVVEPVGRHTLLLRRAAGVTHGSCVALGLTPRQADVALAVLDGATNQQIASRLGLSLSTVRRHLEETFRRLGVASRAQLAVALLSASGTDRVSAE